MIVFSLVCVPEEYKRTSSALQQISLTVIDREVAVELAAELVWTLVLPRQEETHVRYAVEIERTHARVRTPRGVFGFRARGVREVPSHEKGQGETKNSKRSNYKPKAGRGEASKCTEVGLS